MLVRAALADEAAILSELAIRSKAYWGYDKAFMDACRDELTLSPEEITARRVKVAEQTGRVVGFATLEGNPPQGTLGMLFIDPDHIGKGIGRTLFTHMVATARNLGFQRLTIEADPNAEPFYLSMGANHIGSTPSGSIPARTLPLLTFSIKAKPGN